MSAFSDDELARIEDVQGRIGRRRAEALFDVTQRHLSEWGVRR